MSATQQTRDLYESEEPVADLGIDVPRWIDQDIDCATVAAIVEGGCDSGAYMPAVTYHMAVATMAELGNEVTDWLAQTENNVPIEYSPAAESWSGFCCRVLSIAVETWAYETAAELGHNRL